MARADVIREAFRRYTAGELTLAELLAVIVQWRPKA